MYKNMTYIHEMDIDFINHIKKKKKINKLKCLFIKFKKIFNLK